MERIALFFDTNYLYEEHFTLNKLGINAYNKLNKTLEFVKLDKNVSLFVPEVVLCELLFQHKRKINERIEKGDDPFKNINGTPESYYKSIMDKYSSELNVVSMPFDKAKLFNDIFNMALFKRPPFPSDDDKDNGFKDSIILLSLFEFAKVNHYDKFILVTNDAELVKNEDKIRSHFKQYAMGVDENALKLVTGNEFNNEFYEKYGLFKDLRDYLDEMLFWEVDDNYCRSSYISADHDIPIGNHYILYDNTRIYQLEENLFEVEIFISIEPNYDEDSLLVPYGETIHQRECFLLEKIEDKWKHWLYDYNYDIDYEPFIYDDGFLNDEYP